MFACDLAKFRRTHCVSTGHHRRISDYWHYALGTDRVESAFRSENRLPLFSIRAIPTPVMRLACAAAHANLQIFDDEPVFRSNSRHCQKFHAERLAQRRDFHQSAKRAAEAPRRLELRVDDPGYLSASAQAFTIFSSTRGLRRPLGNVVYVLPPVPHFARAASPRSTTSTEAIQACSDAWGGSFN